MIWYLLYPLRGTTEAPALSSSHPLRRFFTRYGRYISRLAVSTLILSTAVATILIYPIPFLFTTDFTNGASNLPHHVWTLAQPLPYEFLATPDVVMRSIWIHSSYMQALTPDVLSSALELQNEFLGVTEGFDPGRAFSGEFPDENAVHLAPDQRDALHIVNGLTSWSWLFQSPLLYWNCSMESILADNDILATVNERKNQSTPANITLRHSIVFSGKRFEDRRLLAADALVITLLHLADSPIGRQWENVAPTLPAKVSHKWDIYPSDGRVTASQLYEFQFRPISLEDSIVLAVAYGLTLSYFLLRLSKIQAVKSQAGLILTVLAQIVFSIASSFTICAVINIDLSRIPRAAYPLVILSMSLENTFRLINAVILTPSEDSTSNRIGHAFGETAHVALTSSLQNVFILLVLSRIVSPGVAAFCIFAAIAIVFDFFFLSTFFLSVLSVDVRRMELGDALAKEALRRKRRALKARNNSWVKKFFSGKLAISTRVAGTAVMIGFVLIAQWHFFGSKGIFQQFLSLRKAPPVEPARKLSSLSLLEDIHQARSPTSWLRLQDHDTAREVIRLFKPSAYSYIARVYEPLIFVKKGSNRMPRGNEPTLLPAAYDFLHHQLATFVVIIIIVMAALRLLTSCLLLDDESSSDDDDSSSEGPNLHIQSLSGGHSLDIVMLAESSGRHAVSVGLDRMVRVWNLKDSAQSYSIIRLDNGNGELFPVLSVALDGESKWLAVLSASRVAFWDLEARKWGRSVAVDGPGRRPEVFFFDHSAPPQTPRLVIIWRDGTLIEVQVTSNEEIRSISICPRFISARPLLSKDSGLLYPKLSILALSRQGTIHVTTRRDATWESIEIFTEELLDSGVHQVVPLSPLPYFLAASIDKIHLIDADAGSITHVFKVEKMKPRSLEIAYFPHRSSTFQSIGLEFLTLCYISAESGNCVLHHFSPQDEDDDGICLRMNTDLAVGGWCTWEAAKEVQRHVPNPGAWGLTSDGSAVGLRRMPPINVGPRDTTTPRVRRRFPERKGIRDTLRRWEVWRTSTSYRAEAVETIPLFGDGDEAGHLVISELGPAVRVGLMSVAFAFGDVIKLVTVGARERFEMNAAAMHRELSMNVTGRRRKQGSLARNKATN